MRRRTLIHGLIGLVTLSGCGVDSFGEFDVSDVREHSECFEEVFPFDPIFLAARKRAKSTGLFFQSRGGSFQFVDTLFIEVYESNVEGQTLTFSQPGDSLDSAMIGEFEPGESCPDLIESMYLDGQVRFGEFDPTHNGYVEGELIGVSIHSGRNDAVIAGSLTGTFEIDVRTGQPYEEIHVVP